MQYKILDINDTIQIGDEYDGCRDPMKDEAKWVPVTKDHLRLNEHPPDPKYPAHTLYRRKISL